MLFIRTEDWFYVYARHSVIFSESSTSIIVQVFISS